MYQLESYYQTILGLYRWIDDCTLIYGSSPGHYSQGLDNSFILVTMCIWLDRIIIHIITRTHKQTSALALELVLALKSLNTIQSVTSQSYALLLMLHCNHLVSEVPHILFTHPIYEQHYFFTSVLHYRIFEMLHLCLKCPTVKEETLISLSSSITFIFICIQLKLYCTFWANCIFALFYAHHTLWTHSCSDLSKTEQKYQFWKSKLSQFRTTWVLFQPVMALVSTHMNNSYRQILKWRGKRRWRLSLFCYLMGCLNPLDHRKEPGIL